jgi:hypothetical protein
MQQDASLETLSVKLAKLLLRADYADAKKDLMCATFIKLSYTAVDQVRI